MVKDLPSEPAHFLSRLRGSMIIEIRVSQFRVEVVFAQYDEAGNEMHMCLVLKKQFSFSAIAKRGSFDPTEAIRKTTDSTDFVLLVGASCSDVAFTDRQLAMELGDRGALSLAFDDNDFEPFELIAVSGPGFSRLEFHYVH